jgi:ketopantoate reductase
LTINWNRLLEISRNDLFALVEAASHGRAICHVVFAALAFVSYRPSHDLLRGKRLEPPWVAGKVVTLGRELGVPTPTFNVMYTALKPYANGAPA